MIECVAVEKSSVKMPATLTATSDPELSSHNSYTRLPHTAGAEETTSDSGHEITLATASTTYEATGLGFFRTFPASIVIVWVGHGSCTTI